LDNDTSSDSTADSQEGSVYSAEGVIQPDSNDDTEEPLSDITQKYLFKIKGEHKLTQAATHGIAKATSELFKVASERLKSRVSRCLEEMDIAEVPAEIEAAFEEFDRPKEELEKKWMNFEPNEITSNYYVVC